MIYEKRNGNVVKEIFDEPFMGAKVLFKTKDHAKKW